MSFLQKWGLIGLIALLLMAGTAGTTWFAADAYYGKKLAAQQASDKQASDDQAAEDAATLSRYAAASQEINNGLKAESADMRSTAADLGMRLAGNSEALRICTNDTMRSSVPNANGSGTSGGSSAPTAATGPTEPTVAIPAGQLRDDLKIAIDGIDAQLAYRKLFRSGDQAPQQ